MTDVVTEQSFKVDGAAYLKDLQKLVSRTEDDLRERAQELSEVHDDLTARYNQAKSTERTLETFESWREEYLTQVAVGWVLTSVFLRYLEDNALIDDLWLSGPGERIKTARDKRTHYFQQHPTHTDREYLQEAFRSVAQLPGCGALFGQERNPLWLLGPSGDLAKEMIAFWQEIDPETGALRRVFGGPSADSIADTRFLGDLYQDLSEAARKRFALLQTPDFVEEFILDRTLEPAIETFGLDGIRMLDPTCGSGHFLLGGFARLLDHRHRTHPGESERVRVQKALDGVYGVDLNPFAVAIARFRLLVAALDASGVQRMKDAPNYEIHVAAGDSLLHGRRFGRGDQGLLGVDKDWLPDAYAMGDFEEATRILSQQYHAVVGNPPYILDKDKAHNAAVRSLYSSCKGKFALSVPLKEVFFDKSVEGQRAGFVGMITSNSFMKREFGKALITDFFPTVDLTHVIDTSGAYIPGHGTPTVILFGRNRQPALATVKAALGIRGEPSTPADPSNGKVWRSIVDNIDQAEAETDFVTVTTLPRNVMHQHPWSLSGGGASELKQKLESTTDTSLGDLAEAIGVVAVTLEDSVYEVTKTRLRRNCVPKEYCTNLIVGTEVRDWTINPSLLVVYPYSRPENEAIEISSVIKLLWPWKTGLRRRLYFSKIPEERGLKWFEYGFLATDKLKNSLTIAFAFVATHNHFVLDRGGKVFNRTAPVIKLPEGASEDDHLTLLGLLNSSVGCFWLKQVCFDKGTASDRGVLQDDPEKFRFEFDGTKVSRFPLPALTGKPRLKLLNLARALDNAGRTLSHFSFKTVIDDTLACTEKLGIKLDQKIAERDATRGLMSRWQEELDWLVYELFGLLPKDSPARSLIWTIDVSAMTDLDIELRPYRYKDASGIHSLDTRSLARLQVIKEVKELRLLESPEHKRRWFRSAGSYDATNLDDSKILEASLIEWLLDRVEKTLSPTPDLTTTARLAEQLAKDEGFLQVAKLYTGRDDFDLTKMVTELVLKEDVPYLSALRYKATGLRKRAQWEKTWDLQRQEDAGQKVGKIPVPPKYGSTDFLKSHYWTLRGKLDVRKERFISYPLAERAADPSPVIGWAGWNHLQQAKALATYFLDRKEQDGWDTDRLTPLLTGILELIPWLQQWHNDIDPTTDQRLGDFYQSFLDDEARALGLTMQDLRDWRPPAKATRKKS